MIHFLTTVIGIVARGPNAKGIAGGTAGAILMLIEPALRAFQVGFAEGVGTSFQDLGLVVGQVVGGYVVGYAITWLSPANTPNGKDA